MVVSNQDIRVTVDAPIIAGDAVTIPCGYVDKEDIKAFTLASDVGSAPVYLSINTDYTITDGNLFLINDLLDGTLTIYRQTPLDQETNYPEVGKFPAAAHEAALDKLTMQQQEQKDAISRAMTVPLNVSVDFSGQLPTPVAGRTIKFNNTLTGFVVSDADPDLTYSAFSSLVEQAEEARDTAIDAKNICEALAGEVPNEVGHGGESLFQKQDESGFEYLRTFGVSAPINKTADYSILNNEWALVDSTSGAVNITLPSTGKCRVTWSGGANLVTIIGTINGETNYIVRTLNDSIDLVSVGANQWRII